MGVLVLDLDLCVFVCTSELEMFNTAIHSLSSQWIPVQINHNNILTDHFVAFINPEKLRRILELTAEEHEGLIFLTAGFWSEESVKFALKTQLALSAQAQELIDTAVFLTPANSLHHFANLTEEDIRWMNKNSRLMAYSQYATLPSDTLFVAVDDNPGHIESYFTNQQVIAIHATTRVQHTQASPEDGYQVFYDFVINALHCIRKNTTASIEPAPLQDAPPAPRPPPAPPRRDSRPHFQLFKPVLEELHAQQESSAVCAN